jgi:branched-chain amino acid transport system substrate-binding protein
MMTSKDYLKGMKAALGEKAASMIAAEESFDVSEPTIDSHIVKLKTTGADVLFDASTPKFAAQSIKKVAELGWRCTFRVTSRPRSAESSSPPASITRKE